VTTFWEPTAKEKRKAKLRVKMRWARRKRNRVRDRKEKVMVCVEGLGKKKERKTRRGMEGLRGYTSNWGRKPEKKGGEKRWKPAQLSSLSAEIKLNARRDKFPNGRGKKKTQSITFQGGAKRKKKKGDG